MLKSKKIVSGLLAILMATSAFAGCDNSNESGSSTPAATTTAENSGDDNKETETDAPIVAPDELRPAPTGKYELGADEGKVLNISCWNDEFKGRFEAYYKDRLPDGVTVNWNITPNEGNAYQIKLDEDLGSQADKAADEKIDIFLIEADYALKYTAADAGVALDVKADLGLTDDDLANQYKYTQEIVTDETGVLRGTTWQATPGLFAYRRSIAKDVLGTDDPVEVQKALSDWTKFNEVAAKAKEKGYFMLSGFDDAYRTFSNNVSAPWVNENNEIIIDANLMTWVDQTKDFTDKGYNNKTSLWNDQWNADQGPNGKVFGFFYSTWGINFTLLGNSLADKEGEQKAGNGAFGDYAVCEGPQAYFWGGTWICGSYDTDNKGLVADVMKVLTCNDTVMKQITIDTQDYTNNVPAMNSIATDASYGSAFLGGQNHIALFAAAAPKINMSNLSAYDQGLNESFQGAMRNYFEGNATKDEALAKFYDDAIVKYPELKKTA